jgi:hypothetical protein
MAPGQTPCGAWHPAVAVVGFLLIDSFGPLAVMGGGLFLDFVITM